MTRRLYVISWLILGAIALVYFFTLFQTYPGPQTARTASAPVEKSAGRDNSPGAADPSLSQALVRMRSEINLLKGSLEAANKENSALKAHITTLESAFGPSTSALPGQSEKPKASALNKEEASRSAPAPEVEITLLPMPGDGFSREMPESPLPISGQTEPKRTQFAVELASGLKEDALDEHWNKLKRRYPKMLDKLEPRSVKTSSDAQGGEETHRLVVGPFDNAAAAARLCARLNAAGAKCEGAVFSGRPVGNVAAR